MKSVKQWMGIVGLVIMGTGLAACNSASIEGDSSYPSGDIEIVVGWGAGGGTDNFARAISRELSDILDVNINVVNQPGASGANAGNYVANQPADGQTIWAISSNYAINVADGKTQHDLSTYTPIGRVQKDTMTLQVQTDRFENYEKFIEEAKENPGKISVGGTGARGFDEIILRQFESEAGVEFNYIPYEDAGEMHAAVLGGHIDAMLDEIGPTAAQLEGGGLEMLLIFSDEQVEGFEDVPLSVDEGVNVVDGQSRGLLVHADTPAEIVEALESALEEAKDAETYLGYEEESYLNLRTGWLDSEGFKEQLESDISVYKEILTTIE